MTKVTCFVLSLVPSRTLTAFPSTITGFSSVTVDPDPSVTASAPSSARETETTGKTGILGSKSNSSSTTLTDPVAVVSNPVSAKTSSAVLSMVGIYIPPPSVGSPSPAAVSSNNWVGSAPSAINCCRASTSA